MSKQRKIWGIVLSVLGGTTAINVVLFLVGVFSPVLFAVLLSVQVIGAALIIWKIVDLTKKLKRKLLEKQLADVNLKKLESDLTAIYKILGIPVQHDDTGRVLTIYELLGLKPMYDDNGKRIKTIYEELGVNPSFDENGKEIPTVVIIKNGINKIAKIKSASALQFTRKLTPEQIEKLILLKLLREKKEEAEKQGDKNKVEKINQAVKKVKDSGGKEIKASKPKEYKPPNAKDVGGPIKIKNGKFVKGANPTTSLSDIGKLFESGVGATISGKKAPNSANNNSKNPTIEKRAPSNMVTAPQSIKGFNNGRFELSAKKAEETSEKTNDQEMTH